MKVLFILYFIIVSFAGYSQTDYAVLYDSAREEYASGNYQGYLKLLQTADSLRPNHPVIIYRLAGALALNDQMEQCAFILTKALLLNANLPVETDSDLSSFRKSTGYEPLLHLKDSLLTPVVKSDLAFEVHESDLHAEGIAFHKASGSWFMSSVHKRKIIRIDRYGNVSDFQSSGENGLMAVMGLAIDQDRQILWVTTVSTAEMIGYTENTVRQSSVYSYDLTTGNLLNTYSTGDNRSHWFGDLTLDESGSVYVSDTEQNTIFKIASNEMTRWVDLSEEIVNLQGITVMKGYLVVTDYITGIYVIDLINRDIHSLNNSINGLILKGIDGIYAYDNSLIAISNGIYPNRVAQLYLDEKLTGIDDFRIIDWNHPAFGEPTQGELVGNSFYYIGNSSWGAYSDDMQLDPSQLPSIKVFKFTLQ